MKSYLYLLFLLCLAACEEQKPKYPVYPVDLDHPDTVSVNDLFSRIEAIPLQTTEKSRFIYGELGTNKGRYYVLDRNQQLFFCFDSTGKFKYVLDNKPGKGKKKPSGYRSILNPYSYYYKKGWYYYTTFRNEVYTKDKEGRHRTAYMWDFGDYNDDKETIVRFPALPPQVLAPIQQVWLKANCAFVLTGARQSENYIYTLVERIYNDSIQRPANERFFHLFCYKPTGRCYYFNQFADGSLLDREIHLDENYLFMLLPWSRKEEVLHSALLDEKSRKVIENLKSTDNPVVLKWFLKP